MPLAALIVELVIAILTHGPDAVRKIIDAFHQSGILTPEQAAAHRAELERALAAPRWQTDAELQADAGATAAAPADGSDPFKFEAGTGPAAGE